MGRYTEKTTITRGEYITLTGLLVIAQRHEREVQIAGDEIARILGEKPDNGHAFDAIYNRYSTDELLRKSEIAVLDTDSPSAATPT